MSFAKPRPSSSSNSSVASESSTVDSNNKNGNIQLSNLSSPSSSTSTLNSSRSSDSISSNASSSEYGSSTGSSSIKEVSPIPYPKANKIFQTIQKKMQSKLQNFKTDIKNENPGKIEAQEFTELPNYYLFVVLNNKLLCVFETNSEFKLDSTNKYENTELLPKNYITSDRFQFKSVSEFKATNNLTADTIPDAKTKYISMDSYSPMIEGGIIYFYVYNPKSILQKTYFTYGSIFIYEEGIASTCEIKDLENGKTISTNNNVLQHGISTTKFDPKQNTFAALILEIKSKIFGSDISEYLMMNKVYIHYLNAISPEDLKVVLENNKDKIKAVVQILYVNISAPSSTSAASSSSKPASSPAAIYNLLHKYINYYYAYKTRSLSKIERYIGPNEYTQFVMHIFDFFEFLMFLKDKNSNPELIKCCIDVYNSYQANCTKGFLALDNKDELIAKIQTQLLQKQKKIYTYLQIVSDTLDYNKRYEVKLNKNRGGEYTQFEKSINENTSMTLALKTKTGSNPELIESITYKFGPFDKIYKPDFAEPKYTEIVKSPEFEQIIAKVTTGSPMMFAFYGSSGSGKTKVLKSVLNGLCNKFGSLQYTNLEIGFKEIFRKYDDGEIYNGDIKNFNLNFGNGQFKLASETTIDLYHEVKLGKKKTFKVGESLDTLLNYFLDENRLTKAILSNYHSSRSHVLCFLKIKKNGSPECNIIFADLAGNEKKYDCSTSEVLKKFKGILKNDKITPFYENEFDSTGNIFDSYKGGKNLKDKMKESPELYNNFIGKACTHRVVEGEFINDSLKQFRTDLEYMVDVKNRENEYYVPDIYHYITDKQGLKTCLQDFCFGKTNCFQLKKVDETVKPSSVIFNSVYEYLKMNLALNVKTPLEFYDKLEVCLFGALNITEKNKPPPTNYVDINKVKSIIRGKDEFTFNNNPSIFETFNREMELTMNYASKINSNNNSASEIDSNNNSATGIGTMNYSFPENYIFELLNSCNNIIEQKDKRSLTLADIETFKGVFDAIDDENAKTAIGTLEFMNRISKFNTVNSICFEKNDNAKYQPLTTLKTNENKNGK